MLHADSGVSHDRILQAARDLEGEIVKTPMLPSRTLSELTGAHVWLKFENFQFTGSFKDRGALIKLRKLDGASRSRGVVAASRGNQAQAVAYHAERLGIPAVIVMPRQTPHVKVERSSHFSAEVILEGENLEEATQVAEAIGLDRGLTFIHPYDDPDIISGQGTIGLEMLDAAPELDSLIVPIGGGGLCSGIAVAAQGRRPNIAIYGVESERFPSMKQALAGDPAECGTATLADGIAVKRPGALTRPIIRERVPESIAVGESALEEAISLLLEVEKTVAEGAGAAALAALLHSPRTFAGQQVGLVLSGGNIDPIVLARVIERDLVRSSRLVRARVILPDRPAALSEIATLIAREEASIVEVHHQRTFTHLSLESAEVDLMLETRGLRHAHSVRNALEAAGYPTRFIDLGPGTARS